MEDRDKLKFSAAERSPAFSTLDSNLNCSTLDKSFTASGPSSTLLRTFAQLSPTWSTFTCCPTQSPQNKESLEERKQMKMCHHPLFPGPNIWNYKNCSGKVHNNYKSSELASWGCHCNGPSVIAMVTTTSFSCAVAFLSPNKSSEMAKANKTIAMVQGCHCQTKALKWEAKDAIRML